MSLPKVQGAGFQEYERGGCPLIRVGGLECVALWRVIDLLRVGRIEACRAIVAASEPLARARFARMSKAWTQVTLEWPEGNYRDQLSVLEAVENGATVAEAIAAAQEGKP